MSPLVPNRPSPSQMQQPTDRALISRPFCSIPEQIMHQAGKTPEAVALVSETETLTYQQLDQRSNQLAHYLSQQGLGTGRESNHLVAVQLTRSPTAIIAFLAILKAGAAYVPIDPNYPAARQQYILQDSKATILLTESCFASAHSGYTGRCICWDTNQADIDQCSKSNPSEISQTTIQPDDLAYIIYTSGTTGNPKGVMITHQGLANHGKAIAKAFNITPADRVLQFSSLSFDIVVEEIYPTLISGAALVLRPEEIATSITAFLQFTATENITILNIPTAFWHELVGGLVRILAKEQPPLTDWLSPTVRLVIVGGEQASRAIYAQWRELFGLYPRWLNAYGPTEATVSATLYDPIAENFDLNGEIPIGRALDNVETLILDEALLPVRPGEAGELYIGGLGLAKGYLNRPEKTAAAFVPHPFRTGDRLYKTGDLVSELPDGNIKFVGRADFQVKIRGFRIELSEIAHCVEQYPGVQQQLVLAREDVPGEKRLVAYVVPGADNTIVDVSALRKFVQKKLPDYMVPSNFVVLDELPTNTNGKVDRQALPVPTPQRSASNPPKTATEQALAPLWKNVLALKNVSTTDNFFELGGSSLKAVHLFSLIEEEFGQKLPLTALIQAPTLRTLATTLDAGENAALWDSLVPLQPHGDKPPLFFLHAVGPSILNYQNLLPYLDPAQPVYALQAKGLDEKQPLLERMDFMAAQYIKEIQKIQPEGPYYLVGHSFGGLMAYEMAQQLYRQGETVGLLGLFDSGTPALSYCQTPPLIYQLYIHCLNLYNAQDIQHKWWYLRERCQPIFQKLLVKVGLSQVPMTQPLPEIYRRIEKIDREALKRYSPQVYPGKMTLFRALEKDPKVFDDEHLGWRYLIEGGLEIHDVPGQHLSLMFEPHVETLAKTLQSCLNQAHQSKAEQDRCISPNPASKIEKIELSRVFARSEPG